MPAKVGLHEEAGAEYDAAFDWYLERSEETAIRFSGEVERALADIGRSPQRWAAGSHRTRSYLLRKFPYVLVYRELASNDIQVVAVAHTSRRPGYWKSRS
jgi:toxin ParE1/3/4